MPDDRTTITELATALGMTGVSSVASAILARPPEVELQTAQWERLSALWAADRWRAEFEAGFMNGRAFLEAADGLRDRPPTRIEWTGGRKPPGDEVVPADLRVDHVYLVSCKYLSNIVVNASPHHLFERLLAGGYGRRGSDWFREVAPTEHNALYSELRRRLDLELSTDPASLDASTRRALAHLLRPGWPGDGASLYQQLVARTAAESARRWRIAIAKTGEQMLWRLLRIGSAPYFVLGAAPRGFLRLRIATPWDGRRDFELRRFEVEPRPGGQPMVGWRAVVRERATRAERTVEGHVEIRWSHGRFAGPPEAKVYLDSRHADVPGYFPLV